MTTGSSDLKAELEQKEARLAELAARLEEEVAARQRAVETMRRQDEYLAALHDTTLGLISRRDLDALLQALVVRACQLLGTPQGFIYLVTPEGDALERQVGVGVFDVNRVPRLKPGEGLSGMVWQTGRTVVTNDYARWPGRPPSISPSLIRAMAGVPLHSGPKVVGVLAVAFEGGSERTFGDEEVALLSRFAELASIALDNARLFEASETQRRDLEKLYQLNTAMQEAPSLAERLAVILRGLQEVMGFARAVIWLPTADDRYLEASAWIGLDVGEDDLVRVPLQEGVPTLSKAYLERREIILDGATPLPEECRLPERYAQAKLLRSRHPIILPLVSRGRCIGILAADRPPGSPHELNLDLLRIFAANAAGAIENARLYDSVQREKRYVEALVENSPVAITTTDLDQRVVSWNPEAKKLFGYAPEEAIGRDLYELIASKELKAEARRHLRRLEDAKRVRAVTRCARKDGTRVDVEFLALPVIVAGEGVGFIAIFHDITELLRARKNAEAANIAKSQFLATMSHELRTPLNAIIGYSEILQEEAQDLGHDQYLPDLQKIHAAGKHLLALVSDILDFSKIEAGKMALHLESFDVPDMVRGVVSAVQPLAAERANTIRLDIAPDVGTMHADPAKVRQILLNLLTNACKFTEGGRVSLQIARQDGVLTFKISDTGIGMSREQLSRLFQTFSQADASATRKYGGTGLGLALSHHLCRLMGGNITATSELHAGSTFIMRLPERVGDGAVPQAQERAGDVLIGKRDGAAHAHHGSEPTKGER